jgi:peptide/nickel transport system permease protein
MTKFLVRRVFFMVFTMFFVSIAVFAITELAPGDIAVSTLGNTITPEQAASFNAQNGLDQPAVTRYLRWLIGSDWQAEQAVGHQVIRIFDKANDRYSWWAVDEDDGVLFQNYTPDGENLIRVERLEDGTTREVLASGDVWQENEDGILVFWGVDQSGHAAMWVKGDNQSTWTLTHAAWTSVAGAPRRYIPLQRGLLRGDPGVSLMTRRPVSESLIRTIDSFPFLAGKLFNTIVLAGIAFALVMPFALILGLFAGLNEGSLIDRFLSISSLVATATPEFSSGVFLILIFSIWLGWFPGAFVQTTETAIFDNPKMLVLPIMTLTLVELGYVLRITRSSMVEVMRTNYIRTAVLKGLPRMRIVFKHAIRNALMAPITIIMLHVNWLIGGIVIVENLFGFPGMGKFILDAALFPDVFGIEAAAMILIIVAVGTQLLADLIYTYLNPRIRYA